MSDMSSRIASLRSLLPELESALESFNASASKFRVMRTINPTAVQPKTLYILDSSFNPPSIAHLTLASSAIRDSTSSEPRPYRLLLLFSTHNADKAPSPASFHQRLTLMTIFAEDLSYKLKSSSAATTSSSDPNAPENISIDIGLTKEPYYTDKSAAIEQEGKNVYPSSPKHVHLVGYDTLKRFAAARYYPKFNPPLSALKPYFEAGHKLRVTQRPENKQDGASEGFGSVEEQRTYLEDLRNGESEQEGFERAWGQQIDMVPGDEGVGVSSTRVRKAAQAGDWKTVSKLCTEGVAAWVKDQALYGDDARGAKMA